MSRRPPLRERENVRLELKAAAVLATPEKVARAAVAMLNAVGGEVWIGIREAPGENVVEPIPDVERKRSRLQDSLLDLIEPIPLHGQLMVSVEAKNESDGSGNLLVTVNPGERPQLYAVFGTGGARTFVRRVDHRTVPMTREEIRASFQSGGADRSERTAGGLARLRAAAKRLHDSPRPRRLSVVLEPDAAGELDLSRVASTELLADPTLSGTPRGSYNYSNASLSGAAVPRHSKAGSWLEAGNESLALRLFESGGIQFEASLEAIAGPEDFISSGLPPDWPWQLLGPGKLNRQALLGYTVTTLRLAALLLQQEDLWKKRPGGPLWAALVITGLKHFVLLPGLCLDLRQLPGMAQHRFEEQDFDEEPRAFPLKDVQHRPDACGLRLLKPLYWSFGWNREDDIPSLPSVGLGNPRI